MLSDELEKMREKYNSMISKKKSIIDMAKEIEKQKQNPIVIKYLELVETYEKLTKNPRTRLDRISDDELLSIVIWYGEIKESNNIYVYIDSFAKNYVCDIEHGANDYIVSKDSPKAYYRLYRNLELHSYQEGYDAYVLVDDCEKFERENIVIYPEGTNCSTDYYANLRNEFFTTSILDSQENALKKVMSLRCVPKR